jgi:hypothetical protein
MSLIKIYQALLRILGIWRGQEGRGAVIGPVNHHRPSFLVEEDGRLCVVIHVHEPMSYKGIVVHLQDLSSAVNQNSDAPLFQEKEEISIGQSLAIVISDHAIAAISIFEEVG